MNTSLDAHLAAHAERHFGIFTRRDALDRVGLSPQQAARRLSSGRWIEVEQGTYRLAGAPLTRQARLWAVVANLDRPAAISRETAAVELGIERAGSDGIHVTVQGSSPLTRRHAVVHRTTTLPSVDLARTSSGIPCTAGERTVVDLAGDRSLGGRLALVDDAVCAEAANRERLHERAIALGPGRAGVGVVAAATAPGSPERFRSWLERVACNAFHTAGVPPAEWNVEVHDRRGLPLAEVDALWRWAPLAVELDGLRFHSSPQQRAADVRRDRRLLIERGIPTLRYSYRDVIDRRLEMISEVRAALAQRSVV